MFPWFAHGFETSAVALVSGPGGSYCLAIRMLSNWQQRLAHVVEMMRDISFQTDPAAITTVYQKRIRAVEQYDRYVSVSRRDLDAPWFRITRDSNWPKPLDPWKERDRLPLIHGGMLAEILYRNEPRLLLNPQVVVDDPAAPYIGGYRTIIAVPHYEKGEAINWVIHLRRDAEYDPEELPELVWLSNLFGRMTYSLVLANRLKSAHDALDAELRLVADVQRSLLGDPTQATPGLRTAAWSQPARRAGGDYYSVLPLSHGRTGLFIADASGHSAPATVLMAMVHTMLNLCPQPEDPAACLSYIDRGLREAGPSGRIDFVTAFFGVFDPAGHSLRFARAGHPPPRLARRGSERIEALDAVGDLPLALSGEAYEATTVNLGPGDLLVCYTDGVTDARNAAGEPFELPRLDGAIAAASLHERSSEPSRVLESLREAVLSFAGAAPEDDCSLLVARTE